MVYVVTCLIAKSCGLPNTKLPGHPCEKVDKDKTFDLGEGPGEGNIKQDLSSD